MRLWMQFTHSTVASCADEGFLFPDSPNRVTTPPQGEDKPSPLLWTSLVSQFVGIVGVHPCGPCRWELAPLDRLQTRSLHAILLFFLMYYWVRRSQHLIACI